MTPLAALLLLAAGISYSHGQSIVGDDACPCLSPMTFATNITRNPLSAIYTTPSVDQSTLFRTDSAVNLTMSTR